MCLAIPAKIEKITGATAVVDFGGVKKTISLGILNGVRPGDYVLVHAGFAIGKVDQKEAVDTLKAIKEFQDIMKP
jgi:hydrogenase expression/formation protein HypC